MRIQSAVKCYCVLTQKQHTTVLQPAGAKTTQKQHTTVLQPAGAKTTQKQKAQRHLTTLARKGNGEFISDNNQKKQRLVMLAMSLLLMVEEVHERVTEHCDKYMQCL
jgi:hypothetical protein